MAAIKVIYNTDGTITVRVGRSIEHIGIEGKTKAQVFDAVKYAAISKGVVLTDESLTEILYEGRT
jgi:hypothetical protein